ncbi:hypothetical protein [Methylosinus sp. H3A]|uniref:hypothetical protein n=1 Tax=Methylosinus sp. H3A TaxID=2785786 RepID=UPI001AEE1E97|nr:hypothetical protein [Methylosinus sp. H3A]
MQLVPRDLDHFRVVEISHLQENRDMKDQWPPLDLKCHENMVAFRIRRRRFDARHLDRELGHFLAFSSASERLSIAFDLRSSEP